MQQLFYCFPHNNILSRDDRSFVKFNAKKSKKIFTLFYWVFDLNLFCYKYLGRIPADLFNLIKNNIPNFDNILTQNPAYEYGIYPSKIYLF